LSSQSKIKESNRVQSVERAVALLRSFTEAEPELGVTELARRLDLHKSTVSRILATLQAEGLVGRNPDTGRYRLSLGLISLAGVALGGLDVRAVAQPHLNKLVEVSQETVNVTVLDGRDCVNIERARSPQPIRYVGWIGRRTPLHCTAAGKVLLAYMMPDARQALLRPPLTAYTEKTITTIETLERSLVEVQGRGYAIVHEEFEEGFSSIAAPVCSHDGQVVAAVSISGPTYRLGPEAMASLAQPLLQITGQISAEMGHAGRWPDGHYRGEAG
jgi:DNA-binding IclR family transcriptional regulator